MLMLNIVINSLIMLKNLVILVLIYSDYSLALWYLLLQSTKIHSRGVMNFRGRVMISRGNGDF